MPILEKTTEIINELNIICNKCGIFCKKNDSHYGLVEVDIEGECKELCDSVSYSFLICEECLEEIFKAFKFQPETKYY
jgi:hypothetical protein